MVGWWVIRKLLLVFRTVDTCYAVKAHWVKLSPILLKADYPLSVALRKEDRNKILGVALG